jgi:peptidoglycan/xylan/chitin deacetylase (PgdA/CDA1 family)
MKNVAKNTLCALYKYSGLMRAQETVSSWAGKSFMTVILFHRVTDEIPEDGLTVSTQWFRGFCRLIQRRFHCVPLSDIVSHVERDHIPRKRLVAITFDDCYRDNLFAARVLAEHGLPATFFVPTRFVGTSHVFPWDAHLKPMANLTWDEVREMVHLGHDIGSHTASHPDMARISEEETRSELSESKAVLEDRLQRPVSFFAYPFGGREHFVPQRLPLVLEAGYRACFSAINGKIGPGMRGTILPREGIPYFRSLLNLELHLTGCLDWVYALKNKVGLVV